MLLVLQISGNNSGKTTSHDAAKYDSVLQERFHDDIRGRYSHNVSANIRIAKEIHTRAEVWQAWFQNSKRSGFLHCCARG